MKLIYVANSRIPTEKAHGVQIMNTCAALSAALAAQGDSLELVIPARANSISADPFDYYGVPRLFRIRRLATVDLMRWSDAVPPVFALQTFTFLISLLWKRMRGAWPRDAVWYGRDELVMGPLALFSRDVFWETHLPARNMFARMAARRARGIVCVTEGLAEHCRSILHAPADKVSVIRNGVDAAAFDAMPSDKASVRRELGLPPVPAKLVTYSGSLALYSWKGVDIFMDALARLGSLDVRFLLVGGSPKDVAALTTRYPDPRFIFAGLVPSEKVRAYLTASDILVLPNKSGDPMSEKFTSPMKLFEYMASGVPIVASDLPSVREILPADAGVFVHPNDPAALASGIGQALADPAASAARAGRARRAVLAYTWTARAQKILGLIRTQR